MKLREICDIYNIVYDKEHPKRSEQQLSKQVILEKKGRDYTIIRELTTEEKLAFTNKFTDYLKDILIKYLSNQDDVVHNYSCVDLYYALGMVNENYKQGRSNVYNQTEPTRYIEIKKFDYNIIDEELDLGQTKDSIIYTNLYRFFTTSSKLLNEIIENSLNSMQKMSLIIWKKSFKLYKKIYLDKNKYYIESHDCTNDEVSYILQWQREILDKLGYKTTYISNKYDREQFKKYVNKKIQETLNYDLYGNSYEILLSPHSMKKELYKIDVKNRLNQNVQTKLLESKEMDNVLKSLNKKFVKEYIDNYQI